ncbi:hypothetical protein EDD18DRAFT_1359904 [Armillaria luteobubalina]|uniref:Uncharacterized protein n=1 Tax=Armillaria luteobubalina TaxID=153913 RepID=A0AA39PPN3_9AGAR|nr:hypothetical protein EDD18DRAFT_1359904 [Armillaria luteobubalina]
MKKFMVQWPLPQCTEEIIGNTPEDVAKQAEQDKHYQKQKKQIQGRFNNNCGKAHVALSAVTGKPITTSLKKKVVYSLQPQHRLRAVQIYSQRYYKIWVQAAIKKAIRQSLLPLSHGQKLTIINKLTHETFQSESDEVKAEIFDTLEQLHEEQAEAAQRGERNAEDYLDAIDAAPAALNRFLHDLALQMGWWFTVIAGGPDPADGGNIRTGSFHVGVNAHQRNFEDEYSHHSANPKDSSIRCMTFEEGVIAPYGRFLKTLFSPEVRAQRACNQADLEALDATLNDDNNDEGEATPGMSDLLSMPPSPSPASLSPPSPSPPSPSPPSPLSPSPPSPPPPPPASSSKPTNADDADPSSMVPSHPDLMVPRSESADEITRDELDPQVWQDAMFGYDFFSMGSTERDRLAYDNLLGHGVFDYEGGSFPLTPHATFAEDDGTGDLDLGFPQEQDKYAQPESESQLPLLPSPTQDDFDDDEICADVPRPFNMPGTSSSTDVDGETTPTLTVNRKRHHRAVDGNLGQQLGEEAATVNEEGGEDTERRVSKRARKLPASHATIAVGWLPSAVQYLMDPNLGSEWLNLLAAWQVLEALISQRGSPSKGQLGANTSRPSSLTTWLQNRHYNVYPQLPASFSAEFLAWWNALQPDWRCSETGPLPEANYSCSLRKALWKGGPNGLLTVLIGLMWWGQATGISTSTSNAATADSCLARRLVPSLFDWRKVQTTLAAFHDVKV